jgi:ABC-type branched-subunit amino acid transport system substrate-binding protein
MAPARVHAALPLTGPAAPLGRELVRGARLAVEARAGAELVVADGAEEAGVDAVRHAADDPRALAVIGPFHSWQVHRTQPVAAAARLLQIAPVATWTGLGGPTLVRLVPHDRAIAASVARRLVRDGVRELLVVHDHDDDYGVPVGAWCTEAAAAAGITARRRPVWDHDSEIAADLGAADAILYAGVPGSGATGLWHTLHELRPGAWLIGSEGVAARPFAASLSPSAAARTRFFTCYTAPFGFHGFEAVRLALDAIAAAGPEPSREAVVAAARATHDRDSVLGRYGLDADGLTTRADCGWLVIEDGELVWEV